jgi:hypothetical protein
VLEEKASEKIKDVVEKTLETTLRDYEVDVVCFSHTLLWQQTDWWKENEEQWRSILPQCTYSVAVDATITQEGQEMSPQTIEPFFTQNG